MLWDVRASQKVRLAQAQGFGPSQEIGETEQNRLGQENPGCNVWIRSTGAGHTQCRTGSKAGAKREISVLDDSELVFKVKTGS